MGTDWVKVTLQIIGGLCLGVAVLSGMNTLLALVTGNGAQAGVSAFTAVVLVAVAAGLFGFARIVAR